MGKLFKAVVGSVSLLCSILWTVEGCSAGPPVFFPQVLQSTHNDLSKPLRQVGSVANEPLPGTPSKAGAAGIVPPSPLLKAPEPVLQDLRVQALVPRALRNFEGINNVNRLLPPSPNGDVSLEHYIQWVNVSFAIYDKKGDLLYGPVAGNTLWAGFGGPCEACNRGDIVVLYDHLADRWLMSQLALPNGKGGPSYQCVAVSATPDPLGAWHRYAYKFDSLIDYPKLGVWPDGYYMSINQFKAGDASWVGGGAAVFERGEMLAGKPARMVFFDLGKINQDFAGLLPADVDGLAPPPGSPGFFAELDDSSWSGRFDTLLFWKFHVDWADPANSTLGRGGGPDAALQVDEFKPLCPNVWRCIPQPGTEVKLDSVADRLMYRLQYRNLSGHESLVVSHTVDVGSGRAGLRWYEIRDPAGKPFIYQQGTFAPNDDVHRWLGSIAMDGQGNIAMGYNASSDTLYPSIRYTGRLAGDAPGTMTLGETGLVAGGGSQTDPSGRWGDYSMLTSDPADDCTFWYTQEYYPTTSRIEWHTRIASFRLPGCQSTSVLTLGATTRGNGSIHPSGPVNVRPGESKTFTITSDEGHCIRSVLVDDVEVGPVKGYTFTNVTSSHTIKAIFSPATTRDMKCTH